MKKIYTFIVCSLLLISMSSRAAIRYVNVDATGLDNGTSWANAFISLQSAFDVAVAGDQIWVAQGTYKPTKDPIGNTSPADPRDKTFYLINAVEVYGGFIGTETAINQRIASNVTILSGDIGTINNTHDNCYHVVLSVSDANTTKLDGFTITAGRADGVINSSIIVETKTIARSFGGGMYNSASSPALINITFSSSLAGDYAPSLPSYGGGGGMYNDGSSPNLTNVVFYGGQGIHGGGMFNENSSSPTLTNVLFSSNFAAGSFGGGIYNNGSSPTFTNVTFSENASLTNFGGGLGGAMMNENSTVIIKNCIFSGNKAASSAAGAGADIGNNNSAVTISFSDLQLADNTTNYPAANFPAIDAGNNIFAQDPLYRNISNLIGSDGVFMTADDGLELKSTSPCINTGTVAGVAANDITGFARVGNPEMGAYEYNPGSCPVFTNNIAYVNAAAVGANNGSTWANAFTNLESALDAARNCGVTQIWVAKGTYRPTADALGNANLMDPRDKTFYLQNGTTLYGGFAGTETLITQRIVGNVTILSGDIGAVNDVADNCYHVVISVSDDNTTKLDGFTITGGNANGSNGISIESYNIYQFLGGGMNNNYSSPSLTNVIFLENSARDGGGMYNDQVCSPALTNIIFSGNTATNNGGGLFNNGISSPVLTNVVFSGNTTTNNGGGIYNNVSCSPTLTNVVFSGNTANSNGGGLYNNISCIPTLTNGIFWGNIKGGSAAALGSDVANGDNSSTLAASYTSMQLANNTSNYPTVNFPNIGTSNNLFAQDPKFVNSTDAGGADNIFMTADDGLELQITSPCINTGTATGAPLTDITGAARLSTTDMGAYENRGSGGCGTFINNIGYVNVAAVGTNNGTTWANAFTDLESALDAARNCGVLQIWVAQGTYKPTKDPFGNASPTEPADKTFYLTNGVAMYGGFIGTETNINQRTAGNVTILSGDIGAAGIASDNCYHVVLSVSDNNTTILDGFTITGGNARNGSSATSIAVETKTVYRYSGGGMRNDFSSPTITNTIFSNNASTTQGGGIFNSSSSPTITNVIFSGNTSSGGGGLCNYLSSPTLTNIVITANSGASGGGVLNAGSTASFTNVTFFANNVSSGGFGSGGGMASFSSSVTTIKNCIFWGNTKEGSATSVGADIETNGGVTASNTSLQLANNATNYPAASFPNIGTGSNLFAQDPIFINAADDDGADNIWMTADDGLSIQNTSPCINVGTAAGATITDITGAARVGNTDMGAYENQNGTVPVTWLYFNGKTIAKDNILSWATAYEQNSKQFDIERSINGTSFSRIGTVTAAGNNNQTSTYQYKDNNIDKLNSEVMFYRLKQIDINGNFKYNNIVKLMYKANGNLQPVIYPNPTQGKFTIVAGDDLLTGSIAVLYDIYGKELKKIMVIANSQVVDISKYANGVYFIKLNNKEVLKLVKQ